MIPNNMFRDHQTQRDYQRNKTFRQQKNIAHTKQGVIVNTFIKDSINNNQNDLCGNFIIPKTVEMPKDLYENPKQQKTLWQKLSENPLLPICATTLAVLGGTATISKMIHNSAKSKLKLPEWKQLPDLPRNMNFVEESHFVTYVAIQNPSVKTALGALATFAFTSCVFIMKNFTDGFKEVWVKKQDADIQRNLQENLIEVETKSFAGKNQIIRNMMREKVDEMSQAINQVKSREEMKLPEVFKGFRVTFGESQASKPNEKKSLLKNSNLFYAIAGIATLGLSVLFTKKIIGNIRKTGQSIAEYSDDINKNIKDILEKSSNETLAANSDRLKVLFTRLNFTPESVKKVLTDAKLEEDAVNSIVDVVKENTKRFVKPPEALGGKRGIQYYGYIDDVNGHFYNWIMNKDSDYAGTLTKNLFLGLATVTGLGYLGKTSVEAVKDVQVKKVNAETELNLHKKLVNVELRNFLAKKRSAIEPLVKEFKNRARKTSDTKKLKIMADDIIYEIKNGAPFVYS